MSDLDALRPMFERILREEIRQAVQSEIEHRHRVSELWTDPSTGQWSASRLGMLVVAIVLFPACLILQAAGYNLGQAWTSFVALAGTLAGIYGLNSAARVWHNGKTNGQGVGGAE